MSLSNISLGLPRGKEHHRKQEDHLKFIHTSCTVDVFKQMYEFIVFLYYESVNIRVI